MSQLSGWVWCPRTMTPLSAPFAFNNSRSIAPHVASYKSPPCLRSHRTEGSFTLSGPLLLLPHATTFLGSYLSTQGKGERTKAKKECQKHNTAYLDIPVPTPKLNSAATPYPGSSIAWGSICTSITTSIVLQTVRHGKVIVMGRYSDTSPGQGPTNPSADQLQLDMRWRNTSTACASFADLYYFIVQPDSTYLYIDSLRRRSAAVHI